LLAAENSGKLRLEELELGLGLLADPDPVDPELVAAHPAEALEHPDPCGVDLAAVPFVFACGTEAGGFLSLGIT